MTGLMALVLVGVALVVLAALLLVTMRHVRRFTRGSTALRAGLDAGIAPLRLPLWTKANRTVPPAD